MRRWLPWTIAGVVLLALGFALTQIPPAPPYEFLRGQRPVEMELSNNRTRKAGELLVYSFKADYRAVRRKADRELKARGFEALDDSSYMRVPTGPAGPGPNTVSIHKDWKTTLVREMAGAGGPGWMLEPADDETGWVTVMVEGAEEPTWFESLRSLLGL